MTLEGLKAAIDAREGKSMNKEQISRIDNAKSHYVAALAEIEKGFIAIRHFDSIYQVDVTK